MKARILIVDDEDSIREMLETLFEAKGATCKTAPSAEDALRFLVKESFDILLVDKNLPGMSGVELIRQVRAADDEVAIMMMTGYASADSIIETLNLGIDAYVEKPFTSIQDLLSSVEAILQGRKKLRSVPPSAVAPASVLATLVAVSSPEDRRIISAALDSTRLELTFADFEGELLEIAGKTAPDLVVVDADAWRDGVPDLVRRINDASPLAAVIVLSSGSLSTQVLRKLIDLGVYALYEWKTDPAWEAKLRDSAARLVVGKR